LASKLSPPVEKPPAASTNHHGFGGLVDVSWELIGIPTVLHITAVGVDAAE